VWEILLVVPVAVTLTEKVFGNGAMEEVEVKPRVRLLVAPLESGNDVDPVTVVVRPVWTWGETVTVTVSEKSPRAWTLTAAEPEPVGTKDCEDGVAVRPKSLRLVKGAVETVSPGGGLKPASMVTHVLATLVPEQGTVEELVTKPMVIPGVVPTTV
jgi:hypothetical protein